jgi:exopolysaccharide production protein ExoZ
VKRLASIQILRAAAALGVVLFHACQWSHVDFAVGAAGVDLFFVISGFVLWTAAAEPRSSSEAVAQARSRSSSEAVAQEDITPGAFLLARTARVAPLYWIATLAVFAVARAWPQALPIVHPDLRHLVLSLLFLPHVGPGDDPFPLLPTGWTLTYEACFYLAFALALACPRDRRLQVLSGVLLAASVLGFGYHGWYTLLCNPLLLEFLAGVWLARLWARGRLQALGAAGGLGLIGLGALALGACQVGGLRDDFLRPFVWAPPAVAIVAGALALEPWIGRGRLARAGGTLGDASYSLYLVQAPLIAAFAWLTPGLTGWARAPLSVLLAVAAGLACWRWLERPLGLALRRLRRNQLARAHRRLGRGLGPAEQEPLAAVDADLA